MFKLPSRRALALSAAVFYSTLAQSASACDVGCMPRGVAIAYAPVVAAPIESTQPKLSWVFKRSTFTNDPLTGARVAQYARKDPVEPLDDQRAVTSSYRRMRSELRGRDGSMDTTFVVQGWGDGGGELGAEWQMFNDVWKEAILSGSFYNSNQAIGPWGSGAWNGNGGTGWNGSGWGGGWPNGGWPNSGWPGSGGWNGGNGGGGWNGGGWNNDGGQHGGGWNHGRGSKGHWPSDNRLPLPVPN